MPWDSSLGRWWAKLTIGTLQSAYAAQYAHAPDWRSALAGDAYRYFFNNLVHFATVVVFYDEYYPLLENTHNKSDYMALSIIFLPFKDNLKEAASFAWRTNGVRKRQVREVWVLGPRHRSKLFGADSSEMWALPAIVRWPRC